MLYIPSNCLHCALQYDLQVMKSANVTKNETVVNKRKFAMLELYRKVPKFSDTKSLLKPPQNSNKKIFPFRNCVQKV